VSVVIDYTNTFASDANGWVYTETPMRPSLLSVVIDNTGRLLCDEGDRKLHSFPCWLLIRPQVKSCYVPLMVRNLTMNSRLSRAGDEIESVLAFSKRVAFQLVDAAIYFIGLWSLVKWLLR
jgi:hypothetical protein